MREPAGVTLTELLISLSIIAILAGLAAPGMVNVLHDASRTAAVNDFFHALFLARSEAARSGRMVSVCRSADRQTCAAPGLPWSLGWIVFVNDDRDDPPVRDAAERVIAAYAGWPRGSIASNRPAYSFRSYAQGVINGTIVFCDPRGSEHARAIIVNHTGRPRVSRRDASGKPLRCTPG